MHALDRGSLQRAASALLLGVAFAEATALRIEALPSILFVAVLGVAWALHVERARLREEVDHDALTSLLNRRGFERLAARELARAQRGDRPMSLAYFDIDAFKEINDARGHAEGDRVLAALGHALGSARECDVAARLGGDEFVLLMSDTDEHGAKATVERVRALFAERVPSVSFTSGLVTFRAPPSDLEQLLLAGDAAMYAAKREGKRRTRLVVLRSSREHRARKWVVFTGAQIALWTLAALAAPNPACAQGFRHAEESTHVWPWDSPPEPAPGAVRVEILGGTTAPVGLEIGARVVIFDRLIASASLGMTTYGGAFGNVVDAYGGNGDLVRTLADGAFTLHAGVGVRPFEGEGLELMLGYTMLAQSVRRFDAVTLADALDTQTGATEASASLMVHALTIEVGWTFVVLEHFLIRPAIGFMAGVDADVAFAGTEGASLGGLSRALTDAILQYGMAPTLSFQLGYRL
jgi:diguanylate cyclase (GGDEF)-like protein